MNYMIELFLDESNYVCRTRVRHVQSDVEEVWENWDEAKLVAFFNQRPELSLVKPVRAERKTGPPLPAQSAGIMANAAPATTSASSSTVLSEARAGDTTGPIGKPRLEKLEIIPAQQESPRRSFDHKQSFDVRLYLDLTEMKPRKQELFDYTATVLTKSLGAERRQASIMYHGTITPSDRMTLNLKWLALPPGIHRIAAFLTLNPKAPDAPRQQDLTASLEGGLFEVY
jgi:hypothetical protein